MLNALKKILAPPSFEGDEDKTYEARIINTVLWLAIGFSALALIARIFIQDVFQLTAILINIIQLLIWIVLQITLRRGKVELTSNILSLSIILTLNIQAFIGGGLHRPLIYTNVIGLSLAALFSTRRVIVFAMVSIGAAVFMFITDGMLLSTPDTPFPLLSTLIVYSLIIIFTAFILQFAANNLHSSVLRARANEEQLSLRNKELQNYQQTLEEQVIKRTDELSKRTKELELANTNNQRRANQFEALAQVAQNVTVIRDIQELLPVIATVVAEKYGFYHVGVFLIDDNNEYAVLTAANSEGGKRMLARNHRLKVGEQGIVGSVTGSGIPRIALDVGADAVFFNNPDLADTHSEMALPLRSGDKVIGALDVQSTESMAFTDEDVQTLELLADQVSLAIENARLFEDFNNNLSELQILMRQSTREAYIRLQEQQNLLGYRYDTMGASPLKERVELEGLAKSKKTDEQTEAGKYVVPIELRGEIIGNLIVQSPTGDEWNDDQKDIIKAVAERVALSAENARLFDETTQRAERERLVSEITGKIRSYSDPQSMIEVAKNELRNALKASRVEIVPQTTKETGKKEAKV